MKSGAGVGEWVRMVERGREGGGRLTEGEGERGVVGGRGGGLASGEVPDWRER